MGKKTAPLPRAACYHRISVDSDESASIEAQRELTSAWCKAHDFEPIDFTDAGISGSGKVTRPAWDEMTRAVDSGSVSVIVVKDISRLARNLKQIVELTEKCRVVTTDGAIDTDSATGGLLISILGSLSSWEREQSVERQRISQAYRKRAGRAVGIAPWGFRNVATSEGSFREINEDEAAVVREVVANVIADCSLGSEARRLNDAGVTTRGGSRWTTDGIINMVDNPSIAGLVPDKDGLLLDEDGVPVYRPHLAIISGDEWDELRRARERGRGNRGQGRSHERLPLAGLVVCDSCGANCHRNTIYKKKYNKEYASYVCGSTVEECDARAWISAPKLHNYVLSELLDSPESVPKGATDGGGVSSEREPDEEGISRRRLIRLEMDNLLDRMRSAPPEQIEGLALKVANLRQQHDDTPIVKELTNLEYEDFTVGEWADRDFVAAARFAIHQIRVKSANNVTSKSAPASDRVKILWHDDVFADYVHPA